MDDRLQSKQKPLVASDRRVQTVLSLSFDSDQLLRGWWGGVFRGGVPAASASVPGSAGSGILRRSWSPGAPRAIAAPPLSAHRRRPA